MTMNNPDIIITPKSKIWVEANGSVIFGNGRVALFEAIDESGSIRQAASKLGMSYRAAWGKIKATEERLGCQLVETHVGGNKSGAQLTPYARNLLSCYKRFKRDATTAVDQLFEQYFDKLFS